MAAETFFHMRDAYNNMGHTTTRAMTIPDAEDQATMVDDQELAEQAQTQVTQKPGQGKNIMLGLALIFIIMFVLGKV
ncbi:hypothetical protein CON65_12595 [Bacillus pseudomycoides]|uniref:Uncharacterized protein n=1 Tax=Bacillus pseudomycoides TaxID=64104 RepID=A0AA91ZT18_9BACI|nr:MULTISPECIES: hypothetical protein [Bacillus]PED82316.1 hypothetical protein CON65_12595 [Bacillus pseudomycoides]PFW63026.1 hypothetical protein COL20_10420 [Bacillus sp. AFS075034]